MKSVDTAELRWSGATTASVDVYRNSVRIATTANDGAHSDSLGKNVRGSYSYRVCEQASSVCSNTVTVTF